MAVRYKRLTSQPEVLTVPLITKLCQQTSCKSHFGRTCDRLVEKQVIAWGGTYGLAEKL